MKIYRDLRKLEIALAKAFKNGVIDKLFFDSLHGRLLSFRHELDQATSDAQDKRRE